MVLMEEKTTSSSAKKTLQISLPYFLHPSDRPGAIITTCMLNGDNYDMWEKAMTNALRAKNKLGFIDGSLKKPDLDTLEASLWIACNSMLISWIFNSIENSIQPSITYEETVKAVWDDLRECFSIGNAPRIHELKG
ncbi:hypothetical protein Salat_1477300 [Sesamum alatum]|uniref:Retrotransposon Copia-like N-terminal domain-containing protein n=1 Tax=Sesamum alatum TaxID=300844 RepID=A0AAE2CM89_9LAMI|nr:hypothetical protein Salat_1477300 [Sesamum alatum]